jgi:hypothetical protein
MSYLRPTWTDLANVDAKREVYVYADMYSHEWNDIISAYTGVESSRCLAMGLRVWVSTFLLRCTTSKAVISPRCKKFGKEIS